MLEKNDETKTSKEIKTQLKLSKYKLPCKFPFHIELIDIKNTIGYF